MFALMLKIDLKDRAAASQHKSVCKQLLTIVTGQSHISEKWCRRVVMQETSEGGVEVGLKIIPLQAKLLRHILL